MTSKSVGTLLYFVSDLGQPAWAWFVYGLIMVRMSSLHMDVDIAEEASECSLPFWKPALASLQREAYQGITNAGVKLQPMGPVCPATCPWMAWKRGMVFPF